MDHMDGGNYTGPALLVATLFINMISILKQADITFALSVVVSLLAITYYILQIKKIKKEK